MVTTSWHKQIKRSFSDALRAAREKAGYDSAQAFAAQLGLEPHTYRQYERGRNPPNPEILTRICGLLGVTPNELLPEATAAGQRLKKQVSGQDLVQALASSPLGDAPFERAAVKLRVRDGKF